MKKFLRVLAVAMLLLVIALPAMADEKTCTTDHSNIVPQIAKEATHLKEGEKVWECPTCGIIGREAIPCTPEHSYTDHRENLDRPSTCTAEGYEVWYCTCDDVNAFIKVPTEKKAHVARDLKSGEKNTDGLASCITKGKFWTKICNECGVPMDVTEKYGDHTKVYEDVAPTCNKDGQKGIYCTTCKTWLDSTVIPATGEHQQGDTSKWVLDKEATCQNKNQYHSWCSKCGEQFSFETGSKLSCAVDSKSVKVTKKATCTAKGAAQGKCKYCGKTMKWDVPMVDHTHTLVETKPTCTENGSNVDKCKVCGKVFGTETLYAAGHTWAAVNVPAKADCQAAESYLECTVCGLQKDYTKIDAKSEHKAGDWTIVRQPNSYQEGKAIKSCVYCGTQMAKKYFTNAASLGNAKVDTSKKDTTTSSSSSSSKNNTTSSSSSSKNNTAATTSTPTVKAVVAVEPVVVTEWKLGEKFEIADGVFMTITLNAETNKYDVVVEGVDNIETAKIAFAKADATEAPADDDYIDLIVSNWVIETADVDEAAILYIVID